MRLKLISIFISLLCIAGIAKAQTTGYTTVSGSKLHDATGTLIASATIRFQPTNNNGVPISFLAGGAGGQTVAYPVSTTVTDGAFSIILADTTLTSPVNVCYAVTLTSNTTGSAIPFPGYSCIQPSGSTWDFDSYVPNLAPLVVAQYGPTGPAGPSCSIAIGTVAALAAGATPTITNSGTSCAATLNFGIPAGSGSGSSSFTLSVNGTAISTSATTITVNGVTL